MILSQEAPGSHRAVRWSSMRVTKGNAERKILMMSILVTGGAGYIRSHTWKVLRRAGFDPIAYDNLTRGNREAVRWGPLEVGELADRGHVRETLTRYRPAAVIYFAALAYVGKSTLNRRA
jgi:UDP-glucose 4-epimerase